MKDKEHRLSFWLLGRFSRNKTSVAATATSAGALGLVGDASLSTNSAAMSKNMEQASRRFQEYLEKQEENDDMPPDITSMSRWISKAEAFSNSSYGNGSLLREASIPASHRALINLAAVTSKCVYGFSGASLGLKTPEKFQSIGPTVDISPDLLFGTIKAMQVGLFTMGLTGDRNLTPVIVVAIRGTASMRDWAVNLSHDGNINPQTTDFLGRPQGQKPYTIHSGYLNSAQQSVSALKDAILQLLLGHSVAQFHQPVQLLFTGHSAGGAVASLLYAHMLNASKSSPLEPLRSRFSSVHLVTFGAPPVVTPSILLPGSSSTYSTRNAACYGVVNEGDPIPRADEAYIDALLKLFIKTPSSTQEDTTSTANPASWQSSTIYPEGGHQTSSKFKLPPPQLRNAGQIVLLRKAQPASSSAHQPTFWNVPAEGSEGAFTDMLFADPAKHHMITYLQRLGLVKNKPPTRNIL